MFAARAIFKSARTSFLPRHTHVRHSSYQAESSSSIERHKRPRHGGQNLSERFRRLERRTRDRISLSQNLLQNIDRAAVPETVETSTAVPVTSAKPLPVFRGFMIPQEPEPPESDACCMSGCAVCIYDLYQESLEAYKTSVKSLRASLHALHIPEAEWPESICEGGGPERSKVQDNRSATLSAFEELERRLKEKRDSQISTEPRETSLSPSRRGRRSSRRDTPLDWQSIYEGMQWVLFSNR